MYNFGLWYQSALWLPDGMDLRPSQILINPAQSLPTHLSPAHRLIKHSSPKPMYHAPVPAHILFPSSAYSLVPLSSSCSPQFPHCLSAPLPGLWGAVPEDIHPFSVYPAWWKWKELKWANLFITVCAKGPVLLRTARLFLLDGVGCSLSLH